MDHKKQAVAILAHYLLLAGVKPSDSSDFVLEIESLVGHIVSAAVIEMKGGR